MHNSTGYLTYIADLLAIRDIVFIPGFGGFVTKYKPATINRHSGYLHPPTKYIAFNEQLDIHNNEFAQYLDEKTDAHYSPRLFDQFIQNLQIDLSNNQVILIPEVGRLYQDYEGVTHFMPDLGNLNSATFGLPTLDFQPIKHAPISFDAVAREKKVQKLVPSFAVAASVVLLALFAWIIAQNINFNDQIAASETAKDTISEMNILPELTPSGVLDEKPEDVSEKDKEDNDIRQNKDAFTEIETPSSEKPPVVVKEAIIIVGAFGNKNNVQKMASRVKQEGYSVFKDEIGSLTRIGVQVQYASPEELKTILNKIQEEIAARAWIL